MNTLPLNIAGIYQITCLTTRKMYIGSAVNIQMRWYGHRSALAQGKHHSKHLQRAWNKYGSAVFILEVLERCSTECLAEREQVYLDLLKPWDRAVGYNVSHYADAPMRGRKASEEARRRMSEAGRTRPPISEETRQRLVNAQQRRPPITEETRQKIGEATRNRSEETRQKLRESRLRQPPLSEDARRRIGDASRNRPPISEETRMKKRTAALNRPPHSEETRQKIRAARAQQKMPARHIVTWIATGEEFLVLLPSFCAENGLSYHAMRSILLRRQKTHRGYTVRTATKEEWQSGAQAPHSPRGDGQAGPAGGDYVVVPTAAPAQLEVIGAQVPHKVR